MEFELVALMLTLHTVIRELNINYNKKFKFDRCKISTIKTQGIGT